MNKSNKKSARNIKFPIIGSIFTAILASLCCTGPLVFILLGIGSVGMFSIFSEFKLIFSSIAILNLAVAYYLTFRKTKEDCEECHTDKNNISKSNIVTLGLSTILVMFFITLPYLNLSDNFSNTQNKINLENGIVKVLIPVNGMSCSGCEYVIERKLKEIDGIIFADADYKKGIVYVEFRKDKISLDYIVDSINSLGYKVDYNGIKYI